MMTKEDGSASDNSQIVPNQDETSETKPENFDSDLSSTDMAVLANDVDSTEQLVENKRRSRILLFVLIASLLVSLAIIIIVPPFDGAAPARAKDANFELSLKENFLTNGQAPRLLLRYAPIQAPLKYALELEQTVEYEQGQPVLVKISAHAVVEKKRADRDQRAVLLTLKDVKVELFDGPKNVDLASIGRMMSDLSLVGKLDPQEGIGRALPLVRFNPQVGRVLYILSDVVRMVWTKLPNEPVGEDATWEIVDSSLAPISRVTHFKYHEGRITASLELIPGSGAQNGGALGVGSAELTTRLIDGKVAESSGNIIQKLNIPQAGLCKKTSRYSLKLLDD